MKTFYFFICSFILLIDISIAQQYTLESAIEQALKENVSIQEKFFAIEQAQMNIGVARGNFLPQLSFESSASRQTSHGGYSTITELSQDNITYGIRASLSLFAGFAHLNALEQAKLEEEIAKQAHRQAELELIANIKINFFSLLKARKNSQLINESIERLKVQIASTQAFVDEGLVPYINLLESKVELSETEEELIQINNTIRSYEVMLNYLLGFSPQTPIYYKGNIEDFREEKLPLESESIQVAENNRPDLAISKLTIDLAKKDSDTLLGKTLPSVNISYENMWNTRDYKTNDYEDYDRNYWNAQLTFSWVLFNGGKRSYEYRSNNRRIKSLHFSYKDLLEKTKTEIIQSHMEILSALERLNTACERLVVAQEAYNQANVRYDNLLGTITELLDAQTSLTQAQVSISEATADYHIAFARYHFYIGK